ncbi:MAG: aspartate aminotransferase family protein [Clostridiaceae bacterium]|nr:aspartate aminotransferase family protein [Clostridiaceae bacterium]
MKEKRWNHKDLKDRAFMQRQQLRITSDDLLARVENSPFGPKAKELLRQVVKYESHGGMSYAIFSVAPIIERAEGPILYDVDGREYIDFLSGFSVSQFGNCQKELTKIIQDQAAKLTHYFDFPHPERIKLAKKLCEHSKIKSPTKVVFGVTGSDGIELAVRAARYYTGQPNILCAYGDYHGVTYGTMGLTSKGGMQAFFYPVRPDQNVGYFNFPHTYRTTDDVYSGYGMESLHYLERALESKETPFSDGYNNITNIAAILVEPFQSSAGYYIPPKEYLQELRRICDKFGFLLIIDEIQAGLGRSGKMWAFEHSGIEPDMIVTSKALGGGLPISVVIAKEEILMEWGPGAHVSTQAGNVLACTAGNYVLDVVSKPEFLAKVNDVGTYFKEGWLDLQKRHPLIGYIDNLGLYTGIEFVKDLKTKEPAPEATTYIRDAAVREGMVFEKGGYYHNRVQLIPALNIPKDVLNNAFVKFDKIIGEAEKKFGISK